jgi:hypothetical protein
MKKNAIHTYNALAHLKFKLGDFVAGSLKNALVRAQPGLSWVVQLLKHFFYTLGKRASLGRALQVRERRFFNWPQWWLRS